MTVEYVASPSSDSAVLVVGAGPAGLAVVYELIGRGIHPRVIDGANRVGQPWRDRHDQLRLNTHRRYSALPGMRFARSAGAFPHRDDMVAYLEDYERRLPVSIEWGVTVDRIESDGRGVRAHTSHGDMSADHIVVATGPDRTPHRPRWPGEADFDGTIVHASEIRDLARLRGRRVLIVGGGNSGVDIANVLTGIDTDHVWMSVRHGVTIVPRRVLGLPMHPFAVAARRAPASFQNVATGLLSRIALGDLDALGLPRPEHGANTMLSERGVSPATDDGFVAALRRKEIELVKEVTRFTTTTVVVDGGEHIDPDIVICATGYRTGLEPIVGHLGVLDHIGRPTTVGGTPSHVPGLWFAGQRPPFHGNLYGRVLMPDPAAAFRETRRVLRPGGSLAFSVFTTAIKNPHVWVPVRTFVERGHMRQPEPGGPGIFSMDDPARIRELVTTASFASPEIEALDFAFHYADDADAWNTIIDINGRLSPIIADLEGDERAATRRAVMAGFGPYRNADGSYDVPAQVWVAHTR